MMFCEKCKSVMTEVVEISFNTKKRTFLVECSPCHRQVQCYVTNLTLRDIKLSTKRYYKYKEVIVPKNENVLDVIMGEKRKWIRRYIGKPEQEMN